MVRQIVYYTDYADIINKALKEGVFLTTKTGDKINTMVIGWGHVGRVWERPVFIAYIRNNRFTREMLDQNPEFSVNVPVNGFTKQVFTICGSISGRNMDKISEAGLTIVPSETISVPAIKEFPLTLECRVLYRQEEKVEMLPEDIQRKFYSKESDPHIIYFGQIVNAYLIK